MSSFDWVADMASFHWVADMASLHWFADMAWCHVENRTEYPKAPFLLSAPETVSVKREMTLGSDPTSHQKSLVRK